MTQVAGPVFQSVRLMSLLSPPLRFPTYEFLAGRAGQEGSRPSPQHSREKSFVLSINAKKGRGLSEPGAGSLGPAADPLQPQRPKSWLQGSPHSIFASTKGFQAHVEVLVTPFQPKQHK